MNTTIHIARSSDERIWNSYVNTHPQASIYHCSGWQDVIQSTYGHKVYCLSSAKSRHRISGLLPLVRIRNLSMKTSLVSMPFCDVGGILADNTQIERILVDNAVKLGKKLGVHYIELRHDQPLSWLSELSIPSETISHKVRMILDIPKSSDELMASFKSKLRSQIKRPLKAGLYSKIGCLELLDDFYKVFASNMKDLGSPVHSKKLIANTLKNFPGQARIILVYKEKTPVSCSLVLGFQDTLENPWASSLRQYNRFSPNMLLYWTMLKYACDKEYRFFDFGRSTPGGGTHHFKKQWGAADRPLYWHYLYLKGKPSETENSEASKFDKAIQCWKKLPLPVTQILGPAIRKHVGL